MLRLLLILLILIGNVVCFSFEYGDSIDVIVYNKFGQEEFSGKFQVNKYGSVVLPFIGEISVKGLDENSLKSEIYNRLHPDVFVSPVVSLNSNQNYFYVSGMVNDEGRFSFSSYTLLSDVILKAGNLRDGADIYDIRIVRGSEEISVDYNSFLKGVSSINPEILSGDRVIVGELDFVYVLGEVSNPFKEYYSKDRDVVDLVLSASYTDRAALRYSRILRRNSEQNTFSQIAVNLENVFKRGKIENLPELMPGDVIFVPKNNGSKLDVFNLTVEKISDIFTGLNNIKILRRNIF